MQKGLGEGTEGHMGRRRIFLHYISTVTQKPFPWDQWAFHVHVKLLK